MDDLQTVEKLSYKIFSFSQAILDQAYSGDKPDAAAAVRKSNLRRPVDHTLLTGFETMSKLDNKTIRKMLDRVKVADVIAALIKADENTKNAVLRNMDQNSREYVEMNVRRLEIMGVNNAIIERCRIVISEAFMEMIRE
jgi:flagellar motor switch protein FliG